MKDLSDRTLSGRYRLMSRIGSGGMGDVYRGHDLLLDRAVAVKVLQASLASDPAFVSRFKQEARAAARLSHPNVVAVHDWGVDEGTAFMVMEHVAGMDLRELLAQRGALEPGEALHVVASVCDALEAAHAAGLVHRDIKPENILLTTRGQVKVADFGIAFLQGTTTSPGGSIPGTLRYMAPEVAAGAEATALSDVWGAGAVLGEMVTGAPPPAETPLLRAHAAPVAPSRIAPGVPAELDRLVLSACAADPSSRFSSAEDMAAAAREASSHVGGVRSVALGVAEVPEVAFDVMPTSVASPRSRRRRVRRPVRAVRRMAFTAAAIVSLALATSAVAALVEPGEVAVPGVEGMTRARAAKILSDTGLEIRIGDSVRSWSVPAGRILRQEPPSGVLEEGQSVVVTISAGAPKVRLPDLSGLDLRVAEARLAARGSSAGRISYEHHRTPAGTVIRHAPMEGLIDLGSVVDLVVSRGPLPVAIPSVGGMRLRDAREAITDAGFRVRVERIYSEEVAPGVVIASDPPAPGEAPERSVIRIVVSKGPRYAEVVMPDVRGLSIEAASRELERLHLRVDVVRSCGDGGSVVSETDPISGTTIRENDLVVLFVC